MMIHKKMFIVVLLAFAAGSVSGQFNIKIGYNAQYMVFNKTNQLFEQYNKNTSDLSLKFEKFHFMHGLELGGRLMLGRRTALDAGFTSLFTTDNGSARNIGGTIANDEWRISQRVLSLGLENYYRIFGFGIQLGNIKTNYLRDFPGAKSKLSVYSESYYNLRFSLIFHAKTGRNAFALKPYYNYPLSSINIATVDRSLNAGGNAPIQENLSSYGIAIVFYNGPQI